MLLKKRCESMGEEFLKKKGIIVNYLASDLLQKKKGDRVQSVTEYQLLRHAGQH